MFDDPMEINVVTVCPSFVEIHSTDVVTGIGIIRRFKGSYASEECSFTISGKDCKFISSIVYPEVKVDGNAIKISGSGVKAKIANLRQKLHDVKLDDAVEVNVNVSTLHKVKKYCETGTFRSRKQPHRSQEQYAEYGADGWKACSFPDKYVLRGNAILPGHRSVISGIRHLSFLINFHKKRHETVGFF